MSVAPGKILAIETATEACSAALYLDGEIQQRFQVQPRGHADLILGMMDALLSEAGLGLRQLDALAFGRGPGAFTGVRIAAGVVQGAAFAAELPVVPVSTLAALAQRHYREQGIRLSLAAFDARMQELYWGAYRVGDSGLVELQGLEQVAGVPALALPSGAGWHGVGMGWAVHGDALRRRLTGRLAGVTPDLLCAAWDVAWLGAAGFAAGRAVAAEQALPVYLRNRVAWRSGG